jgi:calcineurin-like phosphoesterase family protein
MPDVFFTSDEHHGHLNVMKGFVDHKTGLPTSKPRPWTTLEDMTEGLIERHNAVVKPGACVYHLGDMFWRTFGVDNAIGVMQRLNGQHFYILGNHEELMEEAGRSMTLVQQFVWVRQRAKIKVQLDPLVNKKKQIVLDHFAGRVWDGSHQKSWQLYGHSHGALPEDDKLLSFDVGVDAPGNDYTPVSIETVAQRMSLKGTPDTFNQHG